jgi:hypothetical protein
MTTFFMLSLECLNPPEEMNWPPLFPLSQSFISLYGRQRFILAVELQQTCCRLFVSCSIMMVAVAVVLEESYSQLTPLSGVAVQARQST